MLHTVVERNENTVCTWYWYWYNGENNYSSLYFQGNKLNITKRKTAEFLATQCQKRLTQDGYVCGLSSLQ